MIVRVSSIAIVVYYQDSTSNHNASGISASDTKVVYYQDSTSNHNGPEYDFFQKKLSIIRILHQTTTLKKKQ